MIGYAFQFYDTILFHVNAFNYRSQKAVQKLGGKLVEELGEHYLHLKDEREATLTFVITKNEN